MFVFSFWLWHFWAKKYLEPIKYAELKRGKKTFSWLPHSSVGNLASKSKHNEDLKDFVNPHFLDDLWLLFHDVRRQPRSIQTLWPHWTLHLATWNVPSIEDVGRFSRFLTPTPLPSIVFYYYLSANLTPSPPHSFTKWS